MCLCSEESWRTTALQFSIFGPSSKKSIVDKVALSRKQQGGPGSLTHDLPAILESEATLAKPNTTQFHKQTFSK